MQTHKPFILFFPHLLTPTLPCKRFFRNVKKTQREKEVSHGAQRSNTSGARGLGEPERGREGVLPRGRAVEGTPDRAAYHSTSCGEAATSRRPPHPRPGESATNDVRFRWLCHSCLLSNLPPSRILLPASRVVPDPHGEVTRQPGVEMPRCLCRLARCAA